MLDEASLLIRIAQQDRNALSVLYDRYARILYAIAWKSLNSVEDCEEVVLDVFAQVWRIAERYDPHKGSVDRWLFTLARSRILDRLRKLQRFSKVTDAVDAGGEIAFPTKSVDPIEEVEIRERQEQVRAALNQIPVEQREVIELAYYQGLSHSEIAHRTGLSLGTVKTRLRLGLSKLKTVSSLHTL
jgi:RNA polymerase sigma factor (sigma-70 family)